MCKIRSGWIVLKNGINTLDNEGRRKIVCSCTCMMIVSFNDIVNVYGSRPTTTYTKRDIGKVFKAFVEKFHRTTNARETRRKQHNNSNIIIINIIGRVPVLRLNILIIIVPRVSIVLDLDLYYE